MVECSAILISKILKASNRHFSFDGWHRPVPPIPVSQQWPAPADPLRGEKMGSGNIRCPVVRFEPLLPLRPTRRCNSMTWYHGNPTLKRYKGEQVTSESNLMSLRCHFIAVLPLCSYYYFSTPLHCPAYIFVFFPASVQYLFLSVFRRVSTVMLGWPWADWARLIAAQMEGKEET